MIHMTATQAALLLHADCLGDASFRGVTTDSRAVEGRTLFVALRGEQFDGHEFVAQARDNGAVAAMVESPCESVLPCIVVDDTRAAMLHLAAAWRERFDVPVAAVTGSNGKTTVKEMLASVCRQCMPVLATAGNYNNDIGVPLTLFRLDAEHRAAVIELGANHRGEIEQLAKVVKPKVGIITQCAPAHLQGFGTVDDVAQAKGELFEQLTPGGTAIVNADDSYAPLWHKLAADREVLSFGLCNQADVSATWCVQKHATHMMLMTPQGVAEVYLKLPGRHNVMNALAASAAALAMGIALEDVVAGLEAVTPIEGRLRTLEVPGDLCVLDDTYNANPASLKAGLEVLSQCEGTTWLVLGDMAELGESESRFHEEAGVLAREYGVQRLFATGECSRHTVEAFGEGARHFSDQAELIDAVRASVEPASGDSRVTLLVKGSRSMHMERVVDALTEA